jgi:hypothetical protein
MRQLKRFAAACILAASLSAAARAGQMDIPFNQTDGAPGQIDTPPAPTSAYAGEMNCPLSGVDALTLEGALVALLV